MNKKGKVHFYVFLASVLALAGLVFFYARDVANNITLGLDLQGGFEIVYEVSPLEEGKALPDMSVVARSVSKRVDILGVSEPQIIIEGDNRIRVQLAGIKDQAQARKMISSTANLTFRDVNDNLLADSSIIQEGGASLAFQSGMPVVSLKIADTDKFAKITRELSRKASPYNCIVTWLDFEEGDSYGQEAQKAALNEEVKYISIAGVSSEIDGDAVIQGNFTEQEARELADLINSGSLPVKMTEVYSNVVSADYGLDAFNLTAKAGVIGVLLVALFMILIYRLMGVLTSGILVLYIFSVFAIYSLMGGVFTLPGIAALVLGVGMTVDANIITYDRIKDELYAGKSVQEAIKVGQSTSFITIFDAQFTTFLAALIMYIFGTGTVKGFATMLMVTLVCTMVFNVFITRFLLNCLSNSGLLDHHPEWFGAKKKNIPDLKKGEKQFYFGPFKAVDFMKKANACLALSSSVLLCAVILMGINGVSGKGILNLGIDFSSGTKITISSNQTISMEDVKAEFEKMDISVSRYQQSGENTVYVTIKEALMQEELQAVKATFKTKYGIEPNDNVVTPVVGKELVKNAVTLSLLAWVAMLVYVTFRFKWDYAVSCIVALVHDVTIVLAIFAIFRLEVNTELISVCLAIIGYSINNSIVVFDRVRETLSFIVEPNLKRQDYQDIVNEALNKTFTRSVFSSITTILPIIALLTIGSKAIFTFNFAMFIGLIAGTLSSIFIAPYVWLVLRSNKKLHVKKVRKAKNEELDELTIEGIND